MHRQAFLDTIKRINEFVENPMPVEGGPQALEAQSVEMEELINELSSRVQARLAGSALQVSHDKLDELSEDDISNELMDALQIDADDVDIAGRASQLGRERVAAPPLQEIYCTQRRASTRSNCVSASRKRKKPVLMKTLY